MSAEVSIGEPFKGCSSLTNPEELKHRIAVLERGECMFIDKVDTFKQQSDVVATMPITNLETFRLKLAPSSPFHRESLF